MVGHQLARDADCDDDVARDERDPRIVGEPQEPCGLQVRGDLRADDDAPGQHQHAGGTQHDEAAALEHAHGIGPALLDAIGDVERRPQAFDGARREEQRDEGAVGQKVEAAAPHHLHHLGRDGLDDRLGCHLEQLVDRLPRERLAAEIAGKRAEENAEREQRQHEGERDSASHREAAVREQFAEGLHDGLDLPEEHALLQAARCPVLVKSAPPGGKVADLNDAIMRRRVSRSLRRCGGANPSRASSTFYNL